MAEVDVPDLPVSYHLQDDWYLCGAACAQMVIESLGAGLLDQATLYDHHCHDTSTGSYWKTSPNGLQETLNCHRPASFAGYFSVAASPNLDSIARKIVWTIYRYQAAPVALILGDHWIVIRGFDATSLPLSSTDTSYAICGFFINNPSSGLPDHQYPYSAFQADMLPVATSLGSTWSGKYVAVCDSEPMPTSIGTQWPAPKRLKGDRFLPPDEAKQLAFAATRQPFLAQRERWKNSLHDTQPGTPLLVQRLDRLDAFYYLVPMLGPGKAVPVLVNVDARSGVYLQAARISDPRGNALKDLNFDPKAASEKVVGHVFNQGPHGQLTVLKEACALYPSLVWRPCRESMTPYLPFFMFIVGTKRIYVRVDGKIFTKLHLNDRGI